MATVLAGWRPSVPIPSVDLEAELRAAWPGLKENAAESLGLPAATLQHLPLPSAGTLRTAARTVDAVAGLLDGAVSPGDVQAIGALVADASGLAIGAALGSVVPGLGTIIGGLAGALIGGVFNDLFGGDSQAARDRAIQRAGSKAWNETREWERTTYLRAWVMLADATAQGTPEQDRIQAALYRALEDKMTPADDALLGPFEETTREILLDRWGFMPDQDTPIIGWLAIADAERRPLETRTFEWAPGRSVTQYERGKTWSARGPTADERLERLTGRLRARTEYNLAILRRWNAYVFQLAALRRSLAEAVTQQRAGKILVSPGVLFRTADRSANSRARARPVRLRPLGRPKRAKSSSGGGAGLLALAVLGGAWWWRRRKAGRLSR